MSSADQPALDIPYLKPSENETMSTEIEPTQDSTQCLNMFLKSDQLCSIPSVSVNKKISRKVKITIKIFQKYLRKGNNTIHL